MTQIQRLALGLILCHIYFSIIAPERFQMAKTFLIIVLLVVFTLSESAWIKIVNEIKEQRNRNETKRKETE